MCFSINTIASMINLVLFERYSLDVELERFQDELILTFTS